MALRSISEITDDRNHKIRSADDIRALIEKEQRFATDDEKTRIDSLLKDAKLDDDELAAHAEREAQINRVNEATSRLKAPVSGGPAPSQPANLPTNSSRVDVIPYQVKYGKLKAFRDPNEQQAEYNAYKSGQWVRACLFNDFRAKDWCRRNGVEIHNALSEGTNTAGGALVPDEMNQAIINLREEYGVFRQNARIIPMGRDMITVPRRTGGLTATFTGENSALTTSDPTFDNVQLVAKKLGVLTLMSTELAEDAVINLADFLATEMALAFATKEDQCGFIGDGTSTYGGILGVVTKFSTNNASVGTALAGSVDIAGVTHNLFSEIDNTDLTTLMGKLPQYAAANAKWYCSKLAKDVVFSRLMATAGGNTTQTLGGKLVDSYLGAEIVVSQVMPAGAATDYNNLCMLLYGDLSLAATLGERRGIEFKMSMERYFDTDQVGVKATARVDINVHDVGDATNAGPIVGLIGSSS